MPSRPTQRRTEHAADGTYETYEALPGGLLALYAYFRAREAGLLTPSPRISIASKLAAFISIASNPEDICHSWKSLAAKQYRAAVSV